jgi:two-component system, OmpR family, response regulator
MNSEAVPSNFGHAHILMIEDDPEITSLVARYLRSAGYIVSAAADGRGMETVLAHQRVDLVLLDLMLPHGTGFDLCRRIRATSAARIIMVTALASVTDRVAGLDLGADDYIGKPFELAELGARIRAVLRRGDSGDAASREVRFAGWRFEPERRALYSARGVRLTLTGAEVDLLLAFCGHAHQVLSRSQLITLTRGERDAVTERTVDLLVSRLRRKLAQGGRQLELIRTVRSDGYMFDPDFSSRE